MGNLDIALKNILNDLKIDYIAPPPISKRTMEFGIKHSPEFACLPLKINIGNFIEALEKGADTIIMAGGWGPCRFGYYAQVQRDILKDLDYDFDMVILEAPDSNITELFQQLKNLGKNINIWQAMQALKFTWHKISAVDTIEKLYERNLPASINKSDVEIIYKKALQAIDKSRSNKQLQAVLKDSVVKMNSIPRSKEELIKIGLVGEIYTILEPYSNYNIIQKLSHMGVEVSRSVYLSQWINEHLLNGWVKKSNKNKIRNSAKPYLNYWVGGHGLETVGYTVEFAKNDYDGVIQIGPLTCMPEIVAQSVLVRVGEDKNIPYMTMYFDEHAGEAGVNTRLEAFVDMLRRKRGMERKARRFIK